MIHDKIFLNQEETAFVEVYALDPELSDGVKRKWPAIVICPGGGYLISATKEGEAVAMQFLAQGYSCFVLRYSTFLRNRDCLSYNDAILNEYAYYPTQILQLMEVIHRIHEHREAWSIDISNIFTIGFSAGGHISGTLALRWNDPQFLQRLTFVPKRNELKPKGCLLCYPMLDAISFKEKKQHCKGSAALQIELMELCLYGHQQPSEDEIQQMTLKQFITKATPPMFIWHSSQDRVTDANSTTAFIKELQSNEVPCEYHLFSDGEHGLACANKQYAKSQTEIDDTIAMWLPLAFAWLEKMKKVEVSKWVKKM